MCRPKRIHNYNRFVHISIIFCTSLVDFKKKSQVTVASFGDQFSDGDGFVDR